jgi:hypothetical protein
MCSSWRWRSSHEAHAMNPPDSSQNVLLVDHKEGQCRSIVGYVNGEASQAVYCGHPSINKIIEGRAVASSWCAHHHNLYIAPLGRVNLFVRRQSQSPPSKPQPPRAVSTVARTCSECRARFETPHRMQMTCSPSCSQKRKTAKSRESMRIRVASDPHYREHQRQYVAKWRERQKATAASS